MTKQASDLPTRIKIKQFEFSTTVQGQYNSPDILLIINIVFGLFFFLFFFLLLLILLLVSFIFIVSRSISVDKHIAIEINNINIDTFRVISLPALSVTKLPLHVPNFGSRRHTNISFLKRKQTCRTNDIIHTN